MDEWYTENNVVFGIWLVEIWLFLITFNSIYRKKLSSLNDSYKVCAHHTVEYLRMNKWNERRNRK